MTIVQRMKAPTLKFFRVLPTIVLALALLTIERLMICRPLFLRMKN